MGNTEYDNSMSHGDGGGQIMFGERAWNDWMGTRCWLVAVLATLEVLMVMRGTRGGDDGTSNDRSRGSESAGVRGYCIDGGSEHAGSRVDRRWRLLMDPWRPGRLTDGPYCIASGAASAMNSGRSVG